MIIQSLIDYYKILEADGKVPKQGWVVQKVHYAIDLDRGGNLKGIRSILQEIEGKKGKVTTVPSMISLPFSGPRTLQIKPYCLWEKATYVFGLADAKTSKTRALECFKAYRDLHHTVLDALIDNEVAQAILAYLDNWDAFRSEDNEILAEIKDITLSNFIFCVEGVDAYKDKQIAGAWDAYFASLDTGSNIGVSVISGQKTPICMVHPKLTGIAGESAQSSGMSLISFNFDSCCTEGKKQGENAPMSEYETFAYTTALRYMIQQRQNYKIGDITTFFWSKTANMEMQEIISELFYNTMFQRVEPEAVQCIHDLADGYPGVFHGQKIDPADGFCLLGLRPNAARLTVQFFIQDSFGSFAKNISQYFNDIKLCTSSKYYEDIDFSVMSLLDGTRRLNSGDLIRTDYLQSMINAVLKNKPFPTSVLIAVLTRIGREKQLRLSQAAFIKGYLMRKHANDFPLEVLQLGINLDANDTPYLLGRLFFVFELLQKTAIPEVQGSIRVRYMSATSVNPARTMPSLMRLSQAHLTKLQKIREKSGLGRMYDAQIQDLLNRIDAPYPTHMNHEEQSRFYLGYYHQKEYQFSKKTDKSSNADTGDNNAMFYDTYM